MAEATEAKILGDPLEGLPQQHQSETATRASTNSAAEVAGLDALELADKSPHQSRAWRLWRATWPKLAAIALALGVWQLVAMSGWKADYLLPDPLPVLQGLRDSAQTPAFWSSIQTTLRRALLGFSLATAVGLLLGVAVARIPVLRTAIGSLITGLQTMPSIAWFPLATLLFLDESAIVFVIVLGAAPSIANGVISGVDYVQPVLLKAAHNLGARGWRLYRYVVLPASLPSIVAGLKQGWAFAWRSLMAGELLVVIANRPSVGATLQFARDFQDVQTLYGTMIVILIIGIVVDVIFNAINHAIRRRWGVLDVTN